MREIKFRAWTESDKSMTRPLDIGIPDEAEAIRYYGIGQKSGLSILEQFTGLRDKNGKEIYEGDIYYSTYRAGGAGSIRGRSKERIKQIVEWNNRGSWRGKRIEQGRGYGCCHPTCELGEDIEKIGNIHENQELLA